MQCAFAQDAGAFADLVRRIWPALVIEVVDQADEALALNVFAEVRGVMAHGVFDGHGVLDQGFRLHELVQQRQASSRVMQRILAKQATHSKPGFRAM